MLYPGTVTEVKSPDNSMNYNKVQYEYSVQVYMKHFSSVILPNCIVMDEFGAHDDYNDRTLKIGQRVVVMFINGNQNSPIIIGSLRNFTSKIDSTLGHHWERRFNKITQGITSDFNYYLVSDAGPRFDLKTNQISLDDSAGESIILDKDSKTLTINANEWKINIVNNSTFTTGKQLNVSVGENCDVAIGKDCNVTINGKANLTVQGDAQITANANLKADVSGNCDLKASQISLNGQSGSVLTTETQPLVDMITGIPSIGVVDVFAGT